MGRVSREPDGPVRRVLSAARRVFLTGTVGLLLLGAAVGDMWYGCETHAATATEAFGIKPNEQVFYEHRASDPGEYGSDEIVLFRVPAERDRGRPSTSGAGDAVHLARVIGRPGDRIATGDGGWRRTGSAIRPSIRLRP